MDSSAVNRLASELIGKTINQWEIVEYIDCGKSALVFKGVGQEQVVAVKVFNPELIERFNKEAQLERIKRELSLKNNEHDNLVKIFDGGECCETGYLYVVMEYINAPNLEKAMKEIPRDNIRQIIKQVASAALYLENLGLCHRDIKPSNVAITKDFKTAKLLDLGVLKPIGISDLTDEVAEHFVGTLRYSPPEFLFREEEDTIEGWRAVTFYQLGALLHDLIMKKPIFLEHHPYTRLVEAVKTTTPSVEACDVDTDLIHLAQMCLIKDSAARLRLVDWGCFFKDRQDNFLLEELKLRIKQRCEMASASGIKSIISAEEQRNRVCEHLIIKMLGEIEMDIRCECVPNSCFPPLKISKLISGSNAHNQLIVTFEPSGLKMLHNLLYIMIEIEIIEPETAAILINYWVTICSKDAELQQIDSKNFHGLYKGIYDASVIKNKVESLLHLALDAAQKRDVLEENSTVAIEPFEELRG